MRLWTWLICAVMAHAAGALAQPVPQFQVDPFWPKPLPNNWLFGQVASVAIDSQDHVWVLQRPRSLSADEKGATATPPRNKCCVPAPPVMEFDSEGNFLRGWGGSDGSNFKWVGREHGIETDDKGNVWLTGNADNDNVAMKFSADGKFIMQIGKIAPTKGIKRAISLPVSAPFHCALMQPAAQVMQEALSEVKISAPSVPLVTWLRHSHL